MLSDVPGYHQISVGGAVNCGGSGYGSITQFGNFANMIVSFCMAVIDSNTKKVKYIQIEKSNGIHDAEKWEQKYGNTFQLIQDDNMFNSNMISLGINGIHYSYFIKVIDAHFLKEVRMLMSFSQFKHKYESEYITAMKTTEIERYVFMPITARLP